MDETHKGYVTGLIQHTHTHTDTEWCTAWWFICFANYLLVTKRLAYSIACWKRNFYISTSGQHVSNKTVGWTQDLWRSYLCLLFNAIVQTISVPSSARVIAANQYSRLFFFCGCCSDYSTSRQNNNHTSDILSSTYHKKLIIDKGYCIVFVSNKHCLVHND